MNNETKRTLIDKITKLRVAEYCSGLANGIQHQKEAIRQDLKARELYDEILELINS